MIETNKEPLQSLQLGRAVAAIAVVASHAALSTKDLIAPLSHHVQGVLEHGWIGVDFFFVLSGFIIFHSSVGKRPNLLEARKFAVQRAVRIYTPYLPISILMIVLYSSIGSAGGRQWGLFSSLTLMPFGKGPALSVAWTLQHEILFYAIFSFAYFSKRTSLVLGLWTALILTVNFITPSIADRIIPLRLINIEFVLGVAAASIYLNQKVKSLISPILISLSLFGAWVYFEYSRSLSVLFGASIAVALVPLLTVEQRLKLKVNKAVLIMGAASYALYLIHNPWISIATRIAKYTAFLSSPLIVIIFDVISSLLIGLLYHYTVEKPVTKYLKSCIAKAGSKNTPLLEA